jgi:hypothetical protein
VRPYYLDGDLAQNFQRRPFAKAFPVVEGPVIPVISRRLSMAADLWLLCSFQGPWRGMNAGRPPRLVWSRLSGASSRTPADAGLSKLNSMLGLIAATALERSQVVTSSRRRQPSSQVRSTC